MKGVWRIRTKQEQRESCETSDLVADIERRRLEWLGECDYNGSNKGGLENF
jgi:hypothetical protein